MSKAVPHVPLRWAEDRGSVAFGTNHGPEGMPVFGPSQASQEVCEIDLWGTDSMTSDEKPTSLIMYVFPGWLAQLVVMACDV